MGRRRGFGSIRRLPSKRYQASYAGPDQQRHFAPVTFETVADAEAWLMEERKLIVGDLWKPAAVRIAEVNEQARVQAAHREKRQALTVARFAEDWISQLDLRPTTRRDYESGLRNHIAPTIGQTPLELLTKAEVRAWWATLDSGKPRARAKAYQLLHNIMGGALDMELIDNNPVSLPRRTKVRGKRAKTVESLTVDQLKRLADAMPERLRAAVLLAGYCGLRYGELTELRRRDLDLTAGTMKVSRGVVKVTGGYVVGDTKTSAGVRPIHIPPHLIPVLRQHVTKHAAWGQDGLIFPAPNGGHLHSSSFARAFTKAADTIGRPDATPHTLRHTSVSLAHEAGATFATNKARHGHTSDAMSQLYTHSLEGADKRLARQLSRMATE